MNLEQQVCSLDLAKRLKELGVKQKSLFCWKKWESQDDKWRLSSFKGPVMQYEFISAFTVAELGKLLPPRAYSFRGDYDHDWECAIDLLENEYYTTSGGETEVDARAKMLIHLLEQGMIKKE